MKSSKITVWLFSGLIIGGLIWYFSAKPTALPDEHAPPDKLTSSKQTTDQQIQTYTKEEISHHANANDCWLLIAGKVYDVTNFIFSHPGGNAILQGCGKDATDLFETRPMGSGKPHSSTARAIMQKYYIGKSK